MQRKLCDTGWSDVTKKRAQKKHRLLHCLSWREVKDQISEDLCKLIGKSQDVKERMEVGKEVLRRTH